MTLFEQIKQQLQIALNDKQQLLTERILNITSSEDKQKYGKQVYAILQKSYEKIGGLKGSGFTSVEDMINNIPFWKIVKKGDDVVAVHMYKDKSGRKMVACGSDMSKQGRDITKRFLLDDILRDRAYMEVSGRVLTYIKSILTDDEFKKYAIPAEKVKEVFANKQIEIVSEYEYKRQLGSGDEEVKVMFGTLKQPIPIQE